MAIGRREKVDMTVYPARESAAERHEERFLGSGGEVLLYVRL